ncbi:MucR family transcriptional regulator [Oceanidesulfovibrio marinus]|uniref:Transcriptional regulator n=1 Tax=Oceanidesulfovibrio marinus TaxID=370038 RepID=A0A6P1ZHX4_9BACT|nr:MucR family transcriptional regulator [Oceanidesulfovibrio marinus]QJT07463.1 transcriptional regulator [Oceanidesulfovibrio marinus]TVM34624.1 transcriptional regulator [Oceanidesulfovibrio marinus]
MENFVKEALEIVKAQASVRVMTEDEIMDMVRNLTRDFRILSESGPDASTDAPAQEPPVEPSKAIKENAIICLESGKSYKILTRKHLAKFGLTPEEYREKWGYSKNQPLACKSLQRKRRERIKQIKPWELRGQK